MSSVGRCRDRDVALSYRRCLMARGDRWRGLAAIATEQANGQPERPLHCSVSNAQVIYSIYDSGIFAVHRGGPWVAEAVDAVLLTTNLVLSAAPMRVLSPNRLACCAPTPRNERFSHLFT